MTLYRAGVEPLRKSGDEMRLRNHLRWRTERAFVRAPWSTPVITSRPVSACVCGTWTVAADIDRDR